MVDDPGEFETELLISSSLDLLQDPRIKTVRKLKTEQSNLANGGGAPNEPDEPVSKKRDAIPRPKRNFFARN